MDSFVNAISDLFFYNIKPIILAQNDGTNCILNNEAIKIFEDSVLAEISDLFPDIILSEDSPDQICKLSGTSVYYPLNVKLCPESKFWNIELKDSFETDWDEFVHHQRMLHVLFLDLISISDENELYKTLITKAKKILKIDRMGVLLYIHETQGVVGSWGTDMYGNIVDQSDYNSSLDNTTTFKDTLHFKNYIVLTEDTDLYDHGVIVGKGWNTKTTFYAGHHPVGWISCDNLFSKKPLPRWKKEILGELSRMTGQFIFNLRLENHLKHEVERKTIALNKTIQELKETQENLIEAEKMASLGTLISGIAHELNTPIGVALTSSSHINEKTTEIIKNIEECKLTKTHLNNFLQDNMTSNKLTLSSLDKATELVNIFKQLSVDIESNVSEEINLLHLVENVIMSLKYTGKLSNIKIELDIDNNIVFLNNPGIFYQIFTHLINNSIIHGFVNIESPGIKIIGKYQEGRIFIDYFDNGCGIKSNFQKKIFEPFYTTKRSKGHTGLGLSIIYNNILRVGGSILFNNKNKNGVHFKICFSC